MNFFQQADEMININKVDFQNIQNIILGTALKNFNIVTNGVIHNGLSPFAWLDMQPQPLCS